MAKPSNSAGLLARLRRRCPAPLKALVRRMQARGRRRLIRVLATDERAEVRDLEARGLLRLDAVEAVALDRPLAPSELYEIDENILVSSRFFSTSSTPRYVRRTWRPAAWTPCRTGTASSQTWNARSSCTG